LAYAASSFAERLLVPELGFALTLALDNAF
jgi:hypothetical protein